ncbi:lymphotactin [Anolis carolinensis]|uniref:lymphotactin n=1 Tax=Anolis carolinensis TaxID=28377 RepID=UPI002F2B5A27
MKLYLAAILATVFLENFSVHILKGASGSQIIPRSHCTRLETKRIKLVELVSYKRLNNEPVVILINNKGIKICMSSEHTWAKKAIRHLDRKAALAKLKGPTSPEAVTS